jgi:hypothetical protein
MALITYYIANISCIVIYKLRSYFTRLVPSCSRFTSGPHGGGA